MTLELEVFYIGLLCKYMNDLPHNTVKSFYISLLSVTNEEVPRTRTIIGSRAFSVAAPTVWNSLPDNVVNADTLTVFKKTVKVPPFHCV